MQREIQRMLSSLLLLTRPSQSSVSNTHVQRSPNKALHLVYFLLEPAPPFQSLSTQQSSRLVSVFVRHLKSRRREGAPSKQFPIFFKRTSPSHVGFAAAGLKTSFHAKLISPCRAHKYCAITAAAMYFVFFRCEVGAFNFGFGFVSGR